MEIYSAFNIKVNNTNREAGRFPYFFVLRDSFEKFIHHSHTCAQTRISLTFSLDLVTHIFLNCGFIAKKQS